MLKGKKIIVGISGGIAAYKICSLVRLFVKNGAEVRVIMTPSAVNFVSPLTLSVLSQNEVVINMFPDEDWSKSETVKAGTWHISNGMWADMFVVAPATANTMAKINAGISDNFLLSAVLAARCPVVLVPTMDEDMFKNKITQRNLADLKKYGYRILEPVVGELASGLYGMGKMPEPEEIFDYVKSQFIKKDLKGKKILVTAGPTRQPIDAVRYISNYSTGKMGFEIARAAAERGADITLITGPSSEKINAVDNLIRVQTTEEMFEAVKKHCKGSSLVIMTAAVSDFKPKNVLQNKMKKDKKVSSVNLELEKTVDILQYLGKNKKGFILFGFALETDNQIENAKRKLKEKNLDLIVLNDPNVEGAGFGTDTNVASLITNDAITELPLMSKYELANSILDEYLKKK
ncbi:MAG: bifunctional phosphopantothenoylcysteine decarboxylase/phosphopantothenate--cysteine ligase CoaBC [Ignavibacteria bacterium]|nr:bifunctional phosphopantothenoylcysteine decarboxylase/phosphopantothenate--cysteine ligase CoaBC [Ignavibacteria bacterium]